ncbi:MAG: peptidylprolyl isomerase [bacterium]
MVKTAVIRTERGTIRFVLLDKIAPRHVENFVALTNKGYYQNLLFHRVLPGVLIQGGDPKGDGTGGPGYAVKAEFSDYPHTAGTVGMARTDDPDSAGSQFFIARKDMPNWNGTYTVFGQVYEGLDVVNAVAAGEHLLDVRIVEVERAKLPQDILR